MSAPSCSSGIGNGRGRFTIAFHAARDLVTLAESVIAGTVIAGTVIDLVGAIGALILADPHLQRRLRVSPRIVKCAILENHARGPNIDRTSYTATLDIRILIGEPP